jgi:hypothetical protein
MQALPRPASGPTVVTWLASRIPDLTYENYQFLPFAELEAGPGFDAYVRIFNRTRLANSWADVAAQNERTMHALAEWEKISLTDGRTVGVDVGVLPDETFARLCSILDEHTRDSDACYCVVWCLYDPADVPEFAGAPIVRFHGTDHWLMQTSLSGLASAVTEHGWVQPDYLWPMSGSWTVMSHTDFEYAIVGGSRPLIDAIVASPDIEALEVPAGSRWGDTIN